MTNNEKLFWWVGAPIIATLLVFFAGALLPHWYEITAQYWGLQ